MNPVISSLSSSRFRLGLLSLLILSSGGGATYLVSRASASAEDAPVVAAIPPPTKVAIEAVESESSIDFRELLGRVDSMETVEIRPRVSGHIEEVRLKAGQTVNKGDVLFVIDPRWYRSQFDLANAEAERAKVLVDIAESQARRSADLLGSSAISTEEAEIRTSRVAQAKAELLAAQAKLESARLDLEYTEVKAPISGQVNRAYVTQGNMVSGTPGAGTLLTSIVSKGDMYVYADVDEETLLTFNRLNQAGKIVKVNGRVPVAAQLSDEDEFSHQGYIESADNRMDSGTGSLVLRMVFPNPDGKLVPGLAARVRIPVSEPTPTLFVKERAIGTNQNLKFVMLVSPENTVSYRTVKLGPVISGKRIIRDGLQAGDRIVVNGLQKVTPGMTVAAEIAAR